VKRPFSSFLSLFLDTLPRGIFRRVDLVRIKVQFPSPKPHRTYKHPTIIRVHAVLPQSHVQPPITSSLCLSSLHFITAPASRSQKTCGVVGAGPLMRDSALCLIITHLATVRLIVLDAGWGRDHLHIIPNARILIRLFSPRDRAAKGTTQRPPSANANQPTPVLPASPGQ